MPIPAIPAAPVNEGWTRNASLPVPVEWQRTYVSITGAAGQGAEVPLTGFISQNWPATVLQPGATGLDMPPFELHTDDSPNLDGSIFRGTRAATREVLLPLFVYGPDRRTMIQFKRNLATALNPKNGHCVLKFVETDGVPRYLNCYYKAGMEGSETTDASGFTWMKYGVQLSAFDPWFYGDVLTNASWSFGSPMPFLGSTSLLPLTLSQGTLSGNAVNVRNPGDIEAWPVWTVTGPLRSLRVTGPSGTYWEIPAAADGTDVLPAARTLTVDTRPGFKSLLDDQGRNYYPLLSPNPALWSAPVGASRAQIDAVAGSGTASVSMTLSPRYASY